MGIDAPSIGRFVMPQHPGKENNPLHKALVGREINKSKTLNHPATNDTEAILINPSELDQVQELFGSQGNPHPITGARSFFDVGDVGEPGSATGQAAAANADIGNVGVGASAGPGNLGSPANVAAIEAISQGVAPNSPDLPINTLSQQEIDIATQLSVTMSPTDIIGFLANPMMGFLSKAGKVGLDALGRALDPTDAFGKPGAMDLDTANQATAQGTLGGMEGPVQGDEGGESGIGGPSEGGDAGVINRGFQNTIAGSVPLDTPTRSEPIPTPLTFAEQRPDLLNELLSGLLTDTTNPFGTNRGGVQELTGLFDAGLNRLDTELGSDATRSQFDTVFDNPNLGSDLLGFEQNARQQGFTDTLGKTFTGEAFGNIDDDIINSIITERQAPGRQQISNATARGSLSERGSLAANENLTGQEGGARDRVRQEGQSILGGTQADINAIGDTARAGISDFALGDPSFDFSGFNTERQGLIDRQNESLGSDINASLGSTPLFDINSALGTARNTQGAVSGTTPNQSFLDAIASREASGARNNRGIGSQGRGAF